MNNYVYAALTLDKFSFVSNNASIDVIDHATKTIVGNFPVGSFVRCIALSRDNTSLLVGCEDGDARVMDIITGQIRHVYKGHGESVRCISAGSGSEIITCSVDREIERWSSEGVCVQTYLGHSIHVKSVIFSAKRNRIYSAGYSNCISVWDYDSGVEVGKMLGHEEAVSSLAWVQYEETFVSGSSDNSVRLWDAIGMVLMKVIGMHMDAVRSVAASPDGRFVVSGGWDFKVNIWDVDRSQLVHCLSHHRYNLVVKVSISQNGAFLGSADCDGMFHLIKIDPPLPVIIHEGILSTSTHASKNFRLFSDGIIRDSDASMIFDTITALTTCTMLNDCLFTLASNIENPNNNRIRTMKKRKVESNEEALELTAPTVSSAQLWVEAICAMRQHLSLGDDDNPQASQMIHRYRFDTFQLVWFHTGPFGMRVPKTAIELIGSYLLGNGGLPVL